MLNATCVLGALLVATPATAADTVRDRQWHLDVLHVGQAQSLSEGEGVVVAVIDTGVDASHPDLGGSVLVGADFSSDGATGDGRDDQDGHGTAMAGLIAAHGRALGIAPKAMILPVRTATSSFGFNNHIPDGLDWAVEHGAKVVCIASGAQAYADLQTSIENALAHDVIVVAGAGNYPPDRSVLYPAAYPGVIAAVGVDRNGNHAAVSVSGPQAVLAAPAVDIVSTGLRGPGHTGYRTGTGTSDATAIIAGVAALVRSRFPTLSAAEVVHRLTATAIDRGPPGRDDQYGYGIVDPLRALTADVPTLPPTASAVPTTEQAVTQGDGPDPDPFLIVTLSAAALLVFVILAVLIGRRNRSS